MPVKPRVLVTSSLPGEVLATLSDACVVDLHEDCQPLSAGELTERLKPCDAAVCLLTDRIGEEVLSLCPDLKLVANVAVGYDNVDVDALNRHGVLLVNTPGVLDETTADLAFGLLIDRARRISEGDRYLRAGRWTGWEPDLMLGVDVHGKTLGIIGLGRIGRAVARRAHGFGMKILFSSRRAPDEALRQFAGKVGARNVPFDELLSSSDFVSLHCPLNNETRHLIGARELSLMKPTAILINTARGAVVDQEALAEALSRGQLGGAGLDVFDGEPDVPPALIAMDRVVLTPHIGSATIETRSAMASLAVSGLTRAFAGELPPNAVNRDAWDAFRKRAGLS